MATQKVIGEFSQSQLNQALACCVQDMVALTSELVIGKLYMGVMRDLVGAGASLQDTACWQMGWAGLQVYLELGFDPNAPILYAGHRMPFLESLDVNPYNWQMVIVLCKVTRVIPARLAQGMPGDDFTVRKTRATIARIRLQRAVVVLVQVLVPDLVRIVYLWLAE